MVTEPNEGEEHLGLAESLRKEFSFVKGNYAILVASWILMDFAAELPGTYYSLYVLELGATATILGMIGFMSFLVLASVQFPGGYLADKFGRKWLISTMTFGVALSYVLFAIAPSWHFILIGTVLMGLCLIYQPALMAMVADSVPSERRGMGFGIIMLITSASTTPGPFVAGILYNQFGLVQGMRIGYGVVVAMFLCAALLRQRLKETMTMTNGGRPSLNQLARSYPTSLKESFGVWKKLPPSMFYLFLSGVIGTFGFAAVNLYFVVYAVEELLIDPAVWPLILTALFVTMIALAIPIGKLVDKFSRKIPMLCAYVLLGASMWLFVNGDMYRLFLSLVLVGVAQVMANSGFSALQADLTPKEQRGKINGCTNFANNILAASGNLIGGILYEHVSPQSPFLLAMIFIIPPFLLMLTTVHEPRQREE